MLTSDHRSVPLLKVALRLSGLPLDDVYSSLLLFLWSARFKLQTTVEPSLHRARIRYVLTHSFQSGDWSRDLEGKTPTELEDGPVNFPPVSNNKYYIVSQKKAISTPYCHGTNEDEIDPIAAMVFIVGKSKRRNPGYRQRS